MKGERFLDTNVLIYAFAADDPRNARAEALLSEGGVIGVQVLNEFANVAHRKLGWGWPAVESALGAITELADSVRPLTLDIHSRALKFARAGALSFYDALIVAAAAEAGCRLLLTEALQHGRKFDSVTVRNPFL